MSFVRKKTIVQEHQRFETITMEWSIQKRQKGLSFYVLRFGIVHMLLLQHQQKAIHRLGDILFSGAFLDWCYQIRNDEFSPLLLIWRVLGLDAAQKIYKESIQNMYIEESRYFAVVRQVVEFVRDAFGKDLAVDVSRASKDAHERHFEENSFDLSESYRQLALSLKANGATEEGLPYMRKALDVQREVLGVDDPNLYVSVNSLASMLNDFKDYDGSAKLFEEAITQRTRLLGEEHPKTLISIASFAFLLNKMKRYQEAKPYHERVYIGRKKMLGLTHTKTLMSCYNYGICLRELGYLKQALEMLSACYNLRKQILGTEHRTTKNTQTALQKTKLQYQKAIQKLPPELSPIQD